ncbi:MAG: transposase [Dehalococcoidia bacterium]|nr:transposase [Dehalococcoidia bacterium]
MKAPRVSDVPAAVSEDGYSSQIVRKYERTSRQTQDLFRKLYMEGLSTGDFEPVFRELVGETTALSAKAIVRLKSRWEDEYREWRTSRLDSCRYAYIWADGVYMGAGGDREKTALLCVVGANEDGTKELLGMELGYRESKESLS